MTTVTPKYSSLPALHVAPVSQEPFIKICWLTSTRVRISHHLQGPQPPSAPRRPPPSVSKQNLTRCQKVPPTAKPDTQGTSRPSERIHAFKVRVGGISVLDPNRLPSYATQCNVAIICQMGNLDKFNLEFPADDVIPGCTSGFRIEFQVIDITRLAGEWFQIDFEQIVFYKVILQAELWILSFQIIPNFSVEINYEKMGNCPCDVFCILLVRCKLCSHYT